MNDVDRAIRSYWESVGLPMEQTDDHLYTVQEHARDIAKLLVSEWEVPEAKVRAWHAIYGVGAYNGEWRYATISQRRGVEGFGIAVVLRGEVYRTHSSIEVTTIGACVWLGLEAYHEPLDWRIEL